MKGERHQGIVVFKEFLPGPEFAPGKISLPQSGQAHGHMLTGGQCPPITMLGQDLWLG